MDCIITRKTNKRPFDQRSDFVRILLSLSATRFEIAAAAEAILKRGANLGGSGGMLPREILKFRTSEMARNASFLLK